MLSLFHGFLLFLHYPKFRKFHFHLKQYRIWISTQGKGLYHLKDNIFKVMYSAYLPSPVINFMFIDTRGNYWISTYSGLVKIKPDGGYKIFNTDNSILPVNSANSICEDSLTNIWLATAKGLYFIQEEKKEMEDTMTIYSLLKLGLANNANIYCITKANDDAILMSAQSYYKVGRNSGHIWNYIPSTAETISTPKQICCSSDGNSYFLSDYIVYKYCNSVLTKMTLGTIGKVVCMYSDSDNNLIIAGSSAIQIIKNDGSSKAISTKITGLSEYLSIKSIIVDAAKNIWLGTSNYGLVKLKYFNK